MKAGQRCDVDNRYKKYQQKPRSPGSNIVKIPFQKRGHVRTQDKSKNIQPKNIGAETVFQDAAQDRRKYTETYAESQIEINDHQQEQVGHEPSSRQVEEKEFCEKENENTNGNYKDFTHRFLQTPKLRTPAETLAAISI
jgi:hypothetical protein